MALINCPKCSGTVSTKAPACPHCGFTSVNAPSEKERIEKLADELGSMSAAVAEEEGRRLNTNPSQESPADEKTEPKKPAGASMPTYMTVTLAICVLIRGGLLLDKEIGRRQREAEFNQRRQEMKSSIEQLDRILKDAPPAPVFGTKSEHFSLDQYMRVPKANEK